MHVIPNEARKRLIVALDVPSLAEATALVRELAPYVGAFKVGLELLTAEGSPAVVHALHALDAHLFYDGKFDDIPNTVAGAARAVSALNVWMFNVHASAGAGALAAAVANKGQSLVLAVTVLTSLTDQASRRIFGAPTDAKVLQFARMATEAGADGVVCSARELEILRAAPDLDSLATVVPGIRPTWAVAGDQARVMAPREAIVAGASAIVVGRPVLHPPAGISRVEAAALIVEEIQMALGTSHAAPPLPESNIHEPS